VSIVRVYHNFYLLSVLLLEFFEHFLLELEALLAQVHFVSLCAFDQLKSSTELVQLAEKVGTFTLDIIVPSSFANVTVFEQGNCQALKR